MISPMQVRFRPTEEMMKEAVEGEVINAGYPAKIELNTFYSKFEHGQKISIIIKEDEK